MTSSITIDEDTAASLERLRAEMESRTGRSVTRQELVARLVERAAESSGDVVESDREGTVPVSATEREAFHEGKVSSGLKTAEDDVDDVLY